MNDKDNKKPAATKTIVQQRVIKIVGKFSEGLSKRQVVKWACKEFDLSIRSVEKYCIKAGILMQIQAISDRPNQIGLSVKRLDLLWQKTLNAGEYNTALNVIKELNKIYGNYPENDVEQSAKILINNFPFDVNKKGIRKGISGGTEGADYELED